MHPAFFAAPALALALGFGGSAHAHLPAPWRNLSEDKKEVLDTARDFAEAGEYAEARDVLKDAGILAHGRVMLRHHNNQEHHLSPENREAFVEAIENADYEAFSELIADTPFADRVTEEKFDVMIEAREAFRSGDHEEAREILQEADLNKPPRLRMHRFGGGHHEVSAE